MLNHVRCVRVVTFALAVTVIGWGVVMAIRAADSSTQPDSITIAAAPAEKAPRNGGKGPKGGAPQKEAVTLEQVPAAVREAIRKHAGDNALDKLEKEIKGTEEAYKAKWGEKDREQEVKVAPDGALLESKVDIAATDLPEAIAAAAKKELGDLTGAECKRIQEMKKGQARERYEVRVELDGQKKHIAITPDGAVEVKGRKGPKGKPDKAEQPKV